MKRPLKIILFCAIVLLACLLFWLGKREKSATSFGPIEMSNTNANAATVAQPSATNPIATRSAANRGTNPGQGHAPSAVPQTNLSAEERKFWAAVESLNTKMDFWGMVIDQDGKPVPGAKISGNTRTWYITPTLNFDSRFPKVSAVSDSDGRFEMRNLNGDVLSIESVIKQGYELEPTKRDFGYNTSERFSADPNNPIIFRMWKTNIHESLITGEKRFQVAIDGRPYLINLTAGTISESGEGDLKVWIKFPAETNAEQPNNWLAEIDAADGGLLEEHDPCSSMYLAPEIGYTQTFQIARELVRKNQRGMTGQHRFYVALKNGHEYGRITVELFAPYNDHVPGLIDIQYAINPSGSRILKP